jgi:hypothetical protein
MRVRMIEGVQYYPFRFEFYEASGRRRRWVRWSPAAHWARQEFTRELEARYAPSELREGSCTITLVA